MLKVEHPITCLATMALCLCSMHSYVLLFIVLVVNSTGFKFYGVTRSYSSHPFLCALASVHVLHRGEGGSESLIGGFASNLPQTIALPRASGGKPGGVELPALHFCHTTQAWHTCDDIVDR